MTAKDLREKYLRFFEKRGHQRIPSASLVPENDPTALFISAGMHPLVPYLLGEPHPLGKRLCSVQKCLRTDDIDSVGDPTHHTFFEMLGNWSLGDYWKKQAIEWSFEFLTAKECLGIEKERLAVSLFAGDEDAPFDQESEKIWLNLGISPERIAKLPKRNNWWGPAGQTGPCGPDTEMFVWVGQGKAPKVFAPNETNWVEIWNNVFMQYEKKLKIHEFVPLKQKNVDTGMGVERTVAVLQGKNDDYQTELFKPIIKKIEEISGKKYDEEVNQGSMRIIADHLRAATFLIADGVVPSNVERGYILRRLIRRAARHIRRPQYIKPFAREIAAVVIDQYQDVYPELKYNEQELFNILNTEEERFSQTLDRGLKEIEKILRDKDISNPPVGKTKILSGDRAFYLYESFGFPLELTREILMEKGIEIDGEEFKKKLAEHQEKSRKGAKNKFAGGLADHSEIAVCYHTATHLLQAALRKILGNQVHQIGSNITAERARFDFTHPEKLTGQEISKIEKLINEKIAADLPVKKQIMLLAAAKNSGALAFFGEKYPNRVFVYTIGDFSKEICGGPHVTRTSQIGKIKVIREEGAGAGKRRIYLKIDRTYGEAGSF